MIQNTPSKFFIFLSSIFFIVAVVLFMKLQTDSKNLRKLNANIENLDNNINARQTSNATALDSLNKKIATPTAPIVSKPVSLPRQTTVQVPAQIPAPTPPARKKTTRTS